nr:MAG TPA: hypothetical protein [Caudoviricetes sp.]
MSSRITAKIKKRPGAGTPKRLYRTAYLKRI